MIYGYARVSTKGQDRHGNSLQDQTQKLTEAGCVQIFQDSYTGTKMDRPEFSKLLSVLTKGDTLIVTKLDRFARTAADGAKTVQTLVDKGVTINILNMGRADNTPMGKLMITILLGFAEFERDMIVERTAAGKAVAKNNNPDWREGRKRLDLPDFPRLHQLYQEHKITEKEAYQSLGISRGTWRNRCKEVANAWVK